MNSKLDQNKHLKKKWKKTFFDSLETENSYLNVGYWKLKLNRIDQIVCFILLLYKYLIVHNLSFLFVQCSLISNIKLIFWANRLTVGQLILKCVVLTAQFFKLSLSFSTGKCNW